MDKRLAERKAAMAAALRLIAVKQGKIAPDETAQEKAKDVVDATLDAGTSSNTTGPQYATVDDALRATRFGSSMVLPLGQKRRKNTAQREAEASLTD
jgi:hypothetical protein